jgi:hypothetical protein
MAFIGLNRLFGATSNSLARAPVCPRNNAINRTLLSPMF